VWVGVIKDGLEVEGRFADAFQVVKDREVVWCSQYDVNRWYAIKSLCKP
jgi:hypothetical protein